MTAALAPTPTMDLRLRPPEPEDLETLYQIDQACYPPGIAYSKRTLRWLLRLPGADCLVAEVAGEIVGFLLAQRAGERAHLITIDVLAERRRQGVGTALLEAVEQKLASDGARIVELETATTNEAAVAFWHRHGYRTVGVLKRYYLNRVDAYLMRKSFAPRKES